MKVLFIARSTLHSVYGGDTVQLMATAHHLRRLGVAVDIAMPGEAVDYAQYDLLHLFNIIRPADHLLHVARSGKPYVISTIFVDFSEYERNHRAGIAGLAARMLSADGLEYAKALARRIRNGERLPGKAYLWQGHKKSVRQLASGAAALLPNSESEYRRFERAYAHGHDRYYVVYNGIDPTTFPVSDAQAISPRDRRLVICVARIEGKKNQLNLIRALNGTEFELTLIGAAAPNHQAYYQECRKAAAANVRFIDFLPQEQLSHHYLNAKVHVLPSWNETCGLSTMEAAYAGCNVVITDKGDTYEYFGEEAWYCQPGDPASIYQAVREAASAPAHTSLRYKIQQAYTWELAAEQTLRTYERVLGKQPAPSPALQATL